MHDLKQLAMDAADNLQCLKEEPAECSFEERAKRLAAFVASLTDTTPIDPEWLRPRCIRIGDFEHHWSVYDHPGMFGDKDVWLVRMSNGFSLKLGGTVICEKARRCDLSRLLLLLGLDPATLTNGDAP